MQVAVARQLYVAKDEADKDDALKRQAEYTQRTIDSRRAGPMPAGGSHVLAYADKQARPKRTRCSARPTRSPACSKPASKPASTTSC